MNRRVSTDHRDNLPSVLTDYASRPAVKWIGLLVAWVIVTAVLSITHVGVLLVVIMAGLICYVVYAVLRDTPRAGRRAADLMTADHVTHRQGGDQQLSAPDGWLEPAPGSQPPPAQRPERPGHTAPHGWEFRV